VALKVVGIEVTADARQATVALTGDAKSEVTGTDARKLAQQAAQMKIGKCGFSSLGNWTMQAPDGKLLTEAQVISGTVPDGSKHYQELIMKATV
jgi:hypothetical protein